VEFLAVMVLGSVRHRLISCCQDSEREMLSQDRVSKITM